MKKTPKSFKPGDLVVISDVSPPFTKDFLKNHIGIIVKLGFSGWYPYVLPLSKGLKENFKTRRYNRNGVTQFKYDYLYKLTELDRDLND
jgi:hypothetical protein